MNFTTTLRVAPGPKLRLAEVDAAATHGWDKKRAAARLAANAKQLAGWQHRLHAENRRALLVILQGMDASGKDGTIRKVFAGVNPQGCRVTSFKAPSALELAHDFLWRIHHACPARGEIGVFNRSQYEDVLIVRVHELVPETVWAQRYDQINAFEKTLTAAGTTILKFFLHISRAEQRDRLAARLADPSKNWKFNPGDLAERKLWPQYQRAYEDALRRCSPRHAPWFLIPADKKWFRNLAVSSIICETLADMNPRFPQPAPGLDQLKVR